MADAPTLPLDSQLCFSIYSTSIAIHRAYKPMLDELGVTYTQYLALSTLWESDGLTITAIADRRFLELALQPRFLLDLRRDEAAEQQIGDRRQEQRRDASPGRARRRSPSRARCAPRRRRRWPAPAAGRRARCRSSSSCTGRSRMFDACSIASRTPMPRSRSWLANSTIRMPFLAMTPTSSTRPIWL